MSKCALEYLPGSKNRATWGRKDEEYCADFILISRRMLTPEEYRIFNYHFLLGADWKLCCQRLKMDRGLFFHALYRIQQTLGRTFRELKPYALYPLDEYFSSGSLSNEAETSKPNNKITVFPAPRRMEVPLKKVA